MSLLSTSAGAVQDGLFIVQWAAFLVNELEVTSRKFLHHLSLISLYPDRGLANVRLEQYDKALADFNEALQILDDSYEDL